MTAGGRGVEGEEAKPMARIMIVDDEMSILTVLRVLVGSMGHDAVTFRDPAEALRFIDTDEPLDLVLSDLRMTEISGLDVLRAVREKRPRLPVIMVSAYLNGELWEQAFAMGASAYLSKPFKVDELTAKIKTALAGSESPQD